MCSWSHATIFRQAQKWVYSGTVESETSLDGIETEYFLWCSSELRLDPESTSQERGRRAYSALVQCNRCEGSLLVAGS